MKTKLLACFAPLLLAWTSYGQGFPQPPAAPDELQYLRFLLMNVGSIDHGPDAVKSFEDGLMKQFGLNSAESAAIHAAGQELNALLKQIRQSSRAIKPGRSGLSEADKVALSKLAEQREQKLEALANRILSSVRPATAERLRMPGRVLAGKAGPPRPVR